MDNYKPTSVPNIILKLMEKCIKSRLVEFLNKIITYSQFGFKRNVTTNNVILVVDYIYKSIGECNKCMGCL